MFSHDFCPFVQGQENILWNVMKLPQKYPRFKNTCNGLIHPVHLNHPGGDPKQLPLPFLKL